MTHKYTYILLIAFLGLGSCKKFLQIDPPKTAISYDEIFSDDNTATAAVTGIYLEIMSVGNTIFSGEPERSVLGLAGLSADELICTNNNTELLEFQENNLLPVSSKVLDLWKTAYQIIYQCNTVLEGLANAENVTQAMNEQLTGESLFIRAYTYFYLVNLFGDVPLVLTSDYIANNLKPREPVAKVNEQIVSDLVKAKTLLKEAYPTASRARVNKFAATALLARQYLYMKDWENAVAQSSEIIASPMYLLETDFSRIFLKTSQEAIWQAASSNGLHTREGAYFISTNSSYNKRIRLKPEMAHSFEQGDQRFVNWVDSVTGPIFYPKKYKENVLNATGSEYSMMLRIAEQYLIRAEARTHLGDYEDAQDDLNELRTRADLPDTDASDEPSLLLAIEQERKVELFTEWGHRWFDLKRTNRAATVLQYKAGFTVEDELYPIPHVEFKSNPKLGKQNPGYQ